MMPNGTKFNWDKIFSEAHLHSWPTASLSVQNANPSPSQGGRNIFQEDKDEIMRAAHVHGFRIVSSLKAKVISFVLDQEKRLIE